MTLTPDPHEPSGSQVSAEPEALTDPAAPAPVPEPAWLRLHPLTPVIDGGLAMLIIVGVIVANLRDIIINTFVGDRWASELPDEADEWNPITEIISGGYLLIAVLAVLGIIVLIIGFAWLSWRFHSYQINAQAVELRRGILFRKHRRAPLDRIQSVNLQRPLFARIFGLTKIEVQTGGSDGALTLAFLSHAQAKQVRSQILRTAEIVTNEPNETFENAGGAPSDPSLIERRATEFADSDIDEDAQKQHSVVQVPLGRLVGSIVLSHEAFFVYLFVIIIPIFGAMLSWAVLAGLIPVVIAFGGLLISRFNKGFNFTISSTSNGVRTGSGLTATSTDTIPRHRIHAIDVSQPIWWRPFGWWRIRLTTAGAGVSVSSSNQKVLENVMLPVGKHEDVLKVIELISPHLAQEGERHWVLDALDGPGTGFTGAGKRSAWVLLFARRRAGITTAHPATPHETVRIRRGALTRHLVMLPILRSQSLMLHRPLVHRMLGLGQITMHTVMGPASVMMRGLSLQDAQLWFNYLSQRSTLAQRADVRPLPDTSHSTVETQQPGDLGEGHDVER